MKYGDDDDYRELPIVVDGGPLKLETPALGMLPGGRPRYLTLSLDASPRFRAQLESIDRAVVAAAVPTYIDSFVDPPRRDYTYVPLVRQGQCSLRVSRRAAFPEVRHGDTVTAVVVVRSLVFDGARYFADAAVVRLRSKERPPEPERPPGPVESTPGPERTPGPEPCSAPWWRALKTWLSRWFGGANTTHG